MSKYLHLSNSKLFGDNCNTIIPFMKQQYLLPALALCLFLTVSCSDNSSGPDPNPDPPTGNPNMVSQDIGPQGGTITSEGGNLTLSFPEGALPRTETITIETITKDDLGSEFSELADALGFENGWELGPDGLTFDRPVTATISTDQTPLQSADSLGVFAEFLFISDGETLEALDSLRVEADAENNTTFVSGQLSHFSQLFEPVQVSNGVFFSVRNVPEMLEVGGEFDADVVIATTSEGPLGGLTTLQGPARYLDGADAPLVATFPGAPNVDIPIDEGTPDQAGTRFRGQFGYSCSEDGPGNFFTEMRVNVQFDLESGPITAETFSFFTRPVECIETPSETFTLSVQTDGNGQGTVVSDPGNIDLNEGINNDDFEDGTVVILTAGAASGSVFGGWSGETDDGNEETICGNTPTCEVTMNQNRNITATFITDEGTGAVPQINNFSGTATGLTTIEYDIDVHYTDPLGSLELRIDYDDGNTEIIDNQYLEETNEDTYSAIWEYEYGAAGNYMPKFTAENTETGESNTESLEVKKVTITVEKTGDGDGTVIGETGILGPVEFINCGPGCVSDTGQSMSVVGSEEGLPVILSAEAEEGSVFVGWSGDIEGGEGCGGTGDCQVMADDRTITATFEDQSGNQSCTEQPLETGAQFLWGGQVRENDPEGSTNVQATVNIDGAAEFVPGTQDADRGTWTTFTSTEGVLDIGTTAGGEVIGFSFDVKSTGAGMATYTFSASDEGGVRGTFICDFTFE